MDIKIDSRTILRQFTKEFTKEIIDELNIEEFINDINDILDSESVTKRKVRDHFQKLYDKIKK